MNNGKLMCETRLESRESRMSRGQVNESDEDKRPARGGPSLREDNATHYRVRTRGPGPREGDEWMLVRRRTQKQVTHSPTQPLNDVLRSRQPKTHTGGGNN